jgi:adenylate cyclase
MDAERLLAEAEIRAERITALARMSALVLVAIVLYLSVSQSNLAREAAFTRAIGFAWVNLIGYVGLGGVSYVLATPERYRPWMPWVFATCDLALMFAQLVISLESFQLAPMYVATIPALYVSLLILAFTVLRYNPYLQIYVTAVLGVGLLAFGFVPPWWPVNGEPSAHVLEELIAGPPTLIRLAMMVLAGVALTIAAARARALLRRAIDETVRRTNLVRYLPPQIADRLAETGLDAARSGRQHDAAVLFVDIRGFTERAEMMEPAALSRFVAEFRRLMTQAAHAHGGIVDKFIGDNAMIVFGVPEPGPDDARNALHCARAILASVGEWNAARAARGESPVRIGVGAHWGRVFSGAVGDDTRLEFTVLGDTVNVAARLEEATKRAGLPLLVSEDLLREGGADPADGWVALPEAPLRGRHGVVRVYGRAEGVQISA